MRIRDFHLLKRRRLGPKDTDLLSPVAHIFTLAQPSIAILPQNWGYFQLERFEKRTILRDSMTRSRGYGVPRYYRRHRPAGRTIWGPTLLGGISDNGSFAPVQNLALRQARVVVRCRRVFGGGGDLRYAVFGTTLRDLPPRPSSVKGNGLLARGGVAGCRTFRHRASWRHGAGSHAQVL